MMAVHLSDERDDLINRALPELSFPLKAAILAMMKVTATDWREPSAGACTARRPPIKAQESDSLIQIERPPVGCFEHFESMHTVLRDYAVWQESSLDQQAHRLTE